MPKAVLFDLFETLITESDTRPAGAASLGHRLGVDAESFRHEWRRRRPAIALGRLEFTAALAQIGVALGVPIDRAELELIRQERVSIKAAALQHVEPSVLAMLDHLLHRNIRIGVISNCFAEDVAGWLQSPLASRVRLAVFSCEVGLVKPDPQIYRDACERLAVTPGATVFIGDGASDELAGAKAAGLDAFRAVWFLARWGAVPPPDGDRRWADLSTPGDVAAVVV